jgi:hypothetical protein
MMNRFAFHIFNWHVRLAKLDWKHSRNIYLISVEIEHFMNVWFSNPYVLVKLRGKIVF